MNTTIRSRNYMVYLGSEVLARVEEFISQDRFVSGSKKFILVDGNTKKHCLPILQKEVPSLKETIILEITPGESAKSIDTIVKLWQTLTELEAGRNSLLVNLGGGVVCDVGGFTAATFMRGMHFINMPTTLLSMVDASVGGKNGINFGGYKNQVGTFDEPNAVFIFPGFLASLPIDEMRSGFAEVIKHALISDIRKWNEVKTIEQFNNVNWFEIIKESIWTKNKIVNSDFRDKHLRKALNFGHTLGHALESHSHQGHYVPLKHGEAIAIGMLGEVFLSFKCCGLNQSVAEEIEWFIGKHYTHSVDFENGEVLKLIKGDKKNDGASTNFSLISDIGTPVINQHVDDSMILQALDYCKEQMKAGKQ